MAEPVAHRPLRRVLIANRGEIARRLITACRELGLAAVAIASDPDADADWHRDADAVLRLPGASAAETYLAEDRILDAARALGADAVHPGYGFLSERASFAEACAAAGLVFIGPSPSAMRALGAKIDALAAARAAGVPTVPGVRGDQRSDAALRDAASEIGFPVLIKASAGGGGRGMRRVERAEDIADALDAARAEAGSAFGDARVLIEKYFDRARHVEVQVLGDRHGNVRHLFERECSIQRRYQKIVEEAPSPGIDADLRSRMTTAAVDLARSVGYASAGTVEFLVDGDAFYFLEMNTRLQVEHPVTEVVTGIDVAMWQIRVAAGEALPWPQDALGLRGHAIEARVYAEDPASGFMPSIGPIGLWRPPAGPGLRCDDGIATGDRITPHYDAMIAKVIAGAATRAEAIARLRRALRDTVALGVATNLLFLDAVLAHPAFAAGETHTRFLDEHLAGWRPPALDGTDADDAFLAAAALEALSGAGSGFGAGDTVGAEGMAPDPWADAGRWRNVVVPLTGG